MNPDPWWEIKDGGGFPPWWQYGLRGRVLNDQTAPRASSSREGTPWPSDWYRRPHP